MALDDLDSSARPEPPPPPASGTACEPADADSDRDFQIGVVARAKGGGRWTLVAHNFDTRRAAEHVVRAMRGRFPELELRVTVLGFPEEHVGEIQEDASPLLIGDVISDLLPVLGSLVGLMDDDARSLSRAQLRARRAGTPGLRVVRGGG